MRFVLVAIRLSLAAMFLVAAVGKLRDRSGSQQAVADFGVPARYASSGAVALPIGELLITVGLLLDPTSRLGALAAALLLAVFVVAIVRVIGMGEAVECHCFGSVHSSAVGPRTIMRNGFAAALAVYVAISPVAHIL